MKLRALVVDDDRGMSVLLQDILRAEGLTVLAVGNADAALEALRQGSFDLAVLDVGLPGFSGVQLCRHLKQQPETAGLPILMVTSMGRERDKVAGLDAGADDYVTKPFSPAELQARVRALLRRSRQDGAPEAAWTAKDLTLNADTRTVLLKGKPLELRPKEFELLAVFLRKKGRVLTRQFLAEAVWGPEAMATSHTISVSIAGLREKLGSAGQRIVSIVGVGYKFEDD